MDEQTPVIDAEVVETPVEGTETPVSPSQPQEPVETPTEEAV